MSILSMSPDPLWDLGNILYDSTAWPSVTYYVMQCVFLIEIVGYGMINIAKEKGRVLVYA
jgi:hypothetical protein